MTKKKGAAYKQVDDKLHKPNTVTNVLTCGQQKKPAVEQGRPHLD